MTFSNPAAAAPAALQSVVATAFLDKVRYHADQDLFRVVLEMTAIPTYTVSLTDVPLQLEIELPDMQNRSTVAQMSFNDPFVDKLRFVDLGGGRFKAVISLKQTVLPKVSTLISPHRLVIDLLKNYQSQTEYVIGPGLIYREFTTGRSAGPVKAHLLEVDFKAGYTLRPVLSNDSVAGIESLSEMAARTNAVAMVNGPYYMRNGEILGLMKIDRNLVSVSDTPRTSFGILPDGKLIFDAPVYSGHIELPDKTKIPIDGINRGRGESELILYNTYYAYWTLTTGGGREYLVRDGKIILHDDPGLVPPLALAMLDKLKSPTQGVSD